jgi:hypothetical protein
MSFWMAYPCWRLPCRQAASCCCTFGALHMASRPRTAINGLPAGMQRMHARSLEWCQCPQSVPGEHDARPKHGKAMVCLHMHRGVIGHVSQFGESNLVTCGRQRAGARQGEALHHDRRRARQPAGASRVLCRCRARETLPWDRRPHPWPGGAPIRGGSARAQAPEGAAGRWGWLTQLLYRRGCNCGSRCS